MCIFSNISGKNFQRGIKIKFKLLVHPENLLWSFEARICNGAQSDSELGDVYSKIFDLK